MATTAGIPVIDLAGPDVATAIDRACRAHGFFSVVGHGVDPALLDRLVVRAREFFALPDEEKALVAMARGGKAWRGWFPLGGELTSGVPDRKEGLYLGREDDPADPRPLHGANLFPTRPAELGPTVLAAVEALTDLGQRVLALMAEGLGLPPTWFRDHLTADPTVLFRLFHYPPVADDDGAGDWGVAEHTDYGLLTLLLQDHTGGLQVRSGDEWVDVPPTPGALVGNLGDMLERVTGGRYRSTPHRVRSPGVSGRVSCPFFLDPSWDAVVEPLPLPDPAPDEAVARWDGDDPLAFTGTYGDYLLGRVRRVFPALFADVVDIGEE